MDDIIISADDLNVGYDRKIVVDGVNFSIKSGEILSLIGPNGAGKSTVLKTLAGYLQKLSGKVTLCGEDTGRISRDNFSRKLSVVLTERIRPELMTCREVVETGRYPYTGRFGKLTVGDTEVVEKSIKMVEIEEISDKDFNSVSDGQKQRVMLARAICQEPQVLILDEPTSFLDIHHKIAFLEILKKLAVSGEIAVILSMHELDFAKKISDKVLCIKDGTVTKSGTPKEIFTQENIMSLYDISEEMYEKYFR